MDRGSTTDVLSQQSYMERKEKGSYKPENVSMKGLRNLKIIFWKSKKLIKVNKNIL